MTVEAYDGLQVWFLTGSQSLYGEQTLRQVAEQSADVVARLAGAPEIPVQLVAKPVLTEPDAIRRVCLDATADDRCIGVVVWMHTFSPAKMWIGGLDALAKPLLHLNTQANESLPWSTIDMDFMNLNQAAHGDREVAHLEARLNLRRTIVAGHVNSADVRSRIGSWMRAAVGWHAAQHLRMVRFGDNMRNVAVTDGDRVSAQITFGIANETFGVNDLVSVVDAATDAEVDAVVSAYADEYELAPELARGGERHESLRYGARIEVGLRQFLEQGGYGAFTTNFEDLGGLRQLPGLACQRLMSQGYGFGGEGDWKTSALLRIVKTMTAGLPGGTSFMEDYTYHFGPGEPKILGAHMLEVCPTITSARPRVEVHPLGIGGREDPVRLVFTADPGPGVVVCLTDLGPRFRMIANEIDVVEPDQPLPSLPVARAVWKPRPSLSTSAESWMYAGGSHHSVLTTAVGVDVLATFADLARTELLVIDGATTTRDVQRELRWNELYYRLAPQF